MAIEIHQLTINAVAPEKCNDGTGAPELSETSASVAADTEKLKEELVIEFRRLFASYMEEQRDR
ncbi:hypothetical protein P886_4259 [Alteromonadaceae bacterium 2753L.S.0a.02]|nr:hypothetical protein P886_4259 [Alteromonadaceae bacterium 2753L.S.0a.02]